MTSTALPATWGSIDDLLGAREGRFFGEGFKRVHHSLRDLTIDERGITATAHLEIPGAWSLKGATSQRPHLSTIDVMLLGAQLTGLHAAHTRRLVPATPFTIRSLTIKAGRKPQEEDLDTLKVSGCPVDTAEDGGICFECRVGPLTALVEAEIGKTQHMLPPRRGQAAYGTHTELPGPWNAAPFGSPHRDRSQFLTTVEIDATGLAARAELRLAPDGRPSMIDVFVSALQLGQALLYSLDGVGRADSNTLWMRRTTIRPVDAPQPPGEDDGGFRVNLDEPQLLRSKQGAWRRADVVTTYAGWQLRCSVAHLLPA